MAPVYRPTEAPTRAEREVVGRGGTDCLVVRAYVRSTIPPLVDVQPFASGVSLLIPSHPDHRNTDSSSACAVGCHHVLDPRVDEAIPQDVDESDEIGAVPCSDPAQAVTLTGAEPIPLFVGERSMTEGGSVQYARLGVREIPAPGVLDRHAGERHSGRT